MDKLARLPRNSRRCKSEKFMWPPFTSILLQNRNRSSNLAGVFLSAGLDDVDTRATTRVGNSPPQHFMCHRRHIASSEKQKLEQISDRIAFGPLEVAMRDLPRGSLQMNQQGRYRVSDNRTLGAQDSVTAKPLSPNF